MDNYPLGAKDNPNAPYNEKEQFECSECGFLMDKDKGVCSMVCFRASML